MTPKCPIRTFPDWTNVGPMPHNGDMNATATEPKGDDMSFYAISWTEYSDARGAMTPVQSGLDADGLLSVVKYLQSIDGWQGVVGRVSIVRDNTDTLIERATPAEALAVATEEVVRAIVANGQFTRPEVLAALTT